MIARSTIVAVIAVLLSLLLHLMGLVSWRMQPQTQTEPSGGDTSTEIVSPGTTFEDLAEDASEPAPEAEQPVTPTDPVTSDAQIASDTPQDATTPDTGTAQTVEPETTGPAEPATGDTPEPVTVEPADAQQSAQTEPEATPPSGTDTVTEVPQGAPEAAPAPPDATPPPPPPTSSAAVPSTPAPTPPVTSAPVTPTVPLVSVEPSEVEPEPPVTPVEPETQEVPEPVETVEAIESDTSEQATPLSLRPKLPTKRPSFAIQGNPSGSPAVTTARRAPSARIESPLTAYKRTGVDIFAQQSGGARSGGLGSINSRASGNASVTNYAGQVLAKLNRTPTESLIVRGWAQVLFVINPNGSLRSVTVVDSTGSGQINGAARRQVQNSAPFPRPPDGKRQSLTFFYQAQ